jgi:hypothetical protein
MTIRHTVAAVAVSAIALMSGASQAADFAEQLIEAKVASQVAGRATREAVTPALNAAQSLSDWGSQSKAQDYLNFARSKLGLPSSPVIMAAPVIDTPAGTGKVDMGIIGLRDEAH